MTALSSGLLLSLALLAGRLTGFLRELVLAATLGVSAHADLAVLLLTLPDLLVNLLLSGGLAVALIPAMKHGGTAVAASLFRQASLTVLLLFAALAISVAMAPNGWLRMMAPGLTLPEGLLDQRMFFIVVLALPLTALSGVSAAYLNAHDRFFVAGCGTLIFNVCVLAALWSSQSPVAAVLALAWAIAAGAALRWVSQLVAMPRAAWRREHSGMLLTPTLMKAFAAALTAASLLVLVPVILRALASLIGEGTIAAFNYATKLVELPVGILITTLATVAFPKLSELHAEGRGDQAARELSRLMRRAALLSGVVVLTGVWFADAIVALLFLRGNVAAAAIDQVVMLTRVALLSVPFVGVSSLAAASLNARGRTLAALRVTLVSLLLLPVFALPGLWFRSPGGLMAALVAFQVALALGTARAAVVPALGTDGWLDARMLRCFGLVAALVAVGLLVDLAAGATSTLVRSAWAIGVGFAAAAAGLRMLAAVEASKRDFIE